MKAPIAFYSSLGYALRMAEAVAEAVHEVDDVDVELKRIPETLLRKIDEVLGCSSSEVSTIAGRDSKLPTCRELEGARLPKLRGAAITKKIKLNAWLQYNYLITKCISRKQIQLSL